eukprot:scaffold17277_cov36-Phaeocystis_antarctica.AAC.1
MVSRVSIVSSETACSSIVSSSKCAACNASSGHGWNQSMTTQLTRAGKRRQRTRIGSPMGEKQSSTCRLLLTWLTK